MVQSVGPIYERTDLQIIEAFQLYELRLNESLGVEPARLALGPPLNLAAVDVERISVIWRFGRDEIESHFPRIFAPFKARRDSHRKLWHFQFLARLHLHQMQNPDTVLI